MYNSLRTFDPAGIRLEQMIKAGLAMITAMTIMLGVMAILAPMFDIAAVIFSFIVTFVSFMVANEAQPNARRQTILLATLLFIGAPFVAGVVRPYPFAAAILLLAVMFVSFYVRRYGMRAAELGLATVLAYYFSLLFGATLETALWFALGAVIGAASSLFWQFVIRPYSPRRFLRQGIAALQVAVVDAVETVADSLGGERAAPGQADKTRLALKRVHSARQAIEMQLPGVTGAPEWAGVPLDQMRPYLFSVEQGLRDLAAFAGVIAQKRSETGSALGSMAADMLRTLQAALVHANEGEQLEQLERLIAAGQQQGGQAHAQDNDAVKLALAALGAAGISIVKAIRGIENLLSQPHPAQAPGFDDGKQGRLPAKPSVNAAHPYGLHPTAVLGIQAVIACGSAMVISALLGLDRPYWAFWTAFIVVAGPAGESLQKLLLRVLGITLGAIFGTLLVVLLPDSLPVLVALQILALMLVLYTRVINYAWTVFWVTTFVALLYSVQGVPPWTLLVERPVNTLIGAAIAALVVLFVLPIHERDKFGSLLIRFLHAAAGYLAAITGSRAAPPAPITPASALQLSDAYAAVTQTLPALALETNPWLGGQGAAPQAAAVDNLYSEIQDFARFISVGVQNIKAEETALIASMMATIHENLTALVSMIGGQPASLQQLPRRPLDGTDSSLIALSGAPLAVTPDGLSVDVHLFRINQALLQLAEPFQSFKVE